MNTKTTVVISFLLIFCYTIQLEGQITSERKGFRTTYQKDGQTIDLKNLRSTLSADPASSKPFETAKILGYASSGLWVAAAACEGVALFYTIKEAQALNEGDWDAQEKYETKSLSTMLTGVGLMIVAVPVGILSNSQFKKSIKLYNSAHTSGSIGDVTMDVVFMGTGAGIQIRF